MTNTETNQFIEHMDLLGKLHQLIKDHPAGNAIQLIYKPREIELREDEVLVQSVDSSLKFMKLIPTPINQIDDSDTVHEAQIIAADDSGLAEYVRTLHAASCLTRYNTRGECVHIYD